MDKDEKLKIENAGYAAINTERAFDVDDFILALGAYGLEIRSCDDPES